MLALLQIFALNSKEFSATLPLVLAWPLVEACREGIFEGNEPSDLDSDQLKQILGDDMSSSEQEAVVCLAEVRAQEDPEAEAMREALWDIDEFAETR